VCRSWVWDRCPASVGFDEDPWTGRIPGWTGPTRMCGHSAAAGRVRAATTGEHVCDKSTTQWTAAHKHPRQPPPRIRRPGLSRPPSLPQRPDPRPAGTARCIWRDPTETGQHPPHAGPPVLISTADRRVWARVVALGRSRAGCPCTFPALNDEQPAHPRLPPGRPSPGPRPPGSRRLRESRPLPGSHQLPGPWWSAPDWPVGLG